MAALVVCFNADCSLVDIFCLNSKMDFYFGLPKF
jgi:hypothetical protein